MRGLSPKPSSPDTLLNTCLLCFVVAFGGLAIIVLIGNQWPRLANGHADFLAFYTGGALIGTSGLYSDAANNSFQLNSAGFTLDGVQFIRLPLYAAVFWPFSKLPYLPAYWLFQFLNVIALAAYARMQCQSFTAALTVAAFLPVALSFVVGQDACLLLFVFGISMVLLRRNRNTLGGLVLSVCAVKFHLFFLVPIALIVSRRWRALLGSAIGCLLWITLSTAICGLNWFGEYYRVLRNPRITPDFETMSNIFGQFSGVSAVVLTTLLLASMFIAAKGLDISESVAVALAAGLLVNAHSYVSDCVFLLPLLLAAIRMKSAVVNILAVFLLSPIPYIVLMLRHGSFLVLSMTALIASLAASVSASRSVTANSSLNSLAKLRG